MSQNDNLPQRILLCRTDKIGDLILTLPLAAALKKHISGCHITCLVQAYTSDVARQCSAVDEVLLLPRAAGKTDVPELVALLKAGGYDAVFHVFPRPEIAWACFRAGIPQRIGTAYRWYGFLFNRKVRDHRKQVNFHELEYNLRMASAIGLTIPYSPETVDYAFGIREEQLSGVPLPPVLEGLEGPVVILHPGSGGSSVDLPVAKWVELTARLQEQRRCTVVITGSEQERSICETVAGNSGAVCVAGKLNLLQLMVLIQKSDIFAANSTGPLHIAAAMGKKVIGFYPKILTSSPKRWAPYTRHRAVFVPQINCTNCNREQCAKLQCMNTIDMNNVLHAIHEFLQ